MLTHWRCIGNPPAIPPCGAHGCYTHTAKTGDSGEAYKHTDSTGHGTLTSYLPWGEVAA